MRVLLRIVPVFLLSIVIAAVGCGGSAHNSGQLPSVRLTAQPSNIYNGSATTLSWNATNATSVTIAGLGTFAASGSVTVSPSSTTTYTATASGPEGTAKSSVVVTVGGQGSGPTISFNAQPNTIPTGGSAVLAWTTTNATSVSIANVGTFGANGSVKITPSVTTIYTATATGPAGSAKATTVVTVGSGVAPTIAFQAQPSTIGAGQASSLSWSTTNATAVTIAGVGNFGPSGSVNVTPGARITYQATATGPGGSANSSATVTVGVPQFGHVFLLLEENHSYSSVIGNSSVPYLDSLAQQYGLATQYFANTHPSIGNYFMLTTGQIITNDDSYTGTVSVDNIVRHLIAAGKTWKSYAESLPSVGYTGGDVYPYAKHHNPFSYITDVIDSQNQVDNLVPFSQFASDLSNNQLPNFSYIAPNMLDDAHDGSLSQADSWLSTNIAPLIASSTFHQDGLLIIVFDESFDSDTQYGGGQVPAVIISKLVKRGYQSTTLYQHQSTCELILQALGVTSFPGACQGAPQMSEFF